VHSHSSFCSTVIAETVVSCHDLGENQGSFTGCSLDASLPSAFTEVFRVICTISQVVLASMPAPALPVKCSQHRGIQVGFIKLVLVLSQFSCVNPDLTV